MAWLDDNESATSGGGSNRETRSDFRARVTAAVSSLRAGDSVLASLIERHGPCTLEPSTSYFPVVVETIISQQLSTLAARAIYARLIGLVGRRSPRPVDVLSLPDDALLSIGFSRSKARYVKNAAVAFRSGRMGPKSLAAMDDEEITALLTSVKGIGDWSAHMFLIFALGRLDVFPVGDLGLRNAMAVAYGLRRPPAPARLEKIGDLWRPYRTVGTWYLWASYDNQ